MRCCKDLGIASELWDTQFIAHWKATHAVQVFVTHRSKGDKSVLWRRKDAPELSYPWQETGIKPPGVVPPPPQARAHAPPPVARDEAPAPAPVAPPPQSRPTPPPPPAPSAPAAAVAPAPPPPPPSTPPPPPTPSPPSAPSAAAQGASGGEGGAKRSAAVPDSVALHERVPHFFKKFANKTWAEAFEQDGVRLHGYLTWVTTGDAWPPRFKAFAQQALAALAAHQQQQQPPPPAEKGGGGPPEF